MILSGQTVTAVVDFGLIEGATDATVTVPDARVAATTVIVCAVQAAPGVDHDVDDYMVEGVTAHAANIVPGVGYDIHASCVPYGTWGRYQVSAIS
jgi:2-methylaconitate cis-trans-isomerase PrpF